MTQGGAQISERHANFIVNLGAAKADRRRRADRHCAQRRPVRRPASS